MPVISSHKTSNYETTPILFLTYLKFSSILYSKTRAFPSSLLTNPQITFIKLDFPAPLCPRIPKSSPCYISKNTSFKA